MERVLRLAGCVLATVLLAMSMVWGASKGTSGGLLLAYPMGARALAMGEAYSVSKGDLSGVQYNPGVLSELFTGSISVLYEQGVFGDDFGGVLMGYPIGMGAVAASFMYYSAGDIELTKSDGDKRVVQGQTDYLLGLSYGRGVFAGLGVGGSVKILKSTLVEEFSATALCADIGVVYQMGGGDLTVGGTMRNIGAGLKYVEQEDPLPWSVGIAVSYRTYIDKFPIVGVVDVVKTREGEIKQHIGAESFIGGMVAIRAGYKFGYDNDSFTFGVGLRLRGFEIGHGVGLTEDFDEIHLTEIIYGAPPIEPAEPVSSEDGG